jgi:uncharacterized protein YjbI with pentapeptide repeats
MAGKRTRRAATAAGNSQPLLIEGLPRVSAADLQREGGLDGALLEDADASQLQAPSLRLAEVGLHRVDLNGSRLRGLRLVDVLATAVNAANGSWPGARMNRVTFQRSTLVGVDLAEGSLSATTFCECKLDLVNLRMSSIDDVAFVRCSLRGADFYEASLKSVRFCGCELHETDFNRASLERVDLRTSTLVDVRGTASLKGAIIDASQLIDLAPSLAGELGIRVAEVGE